MAPRINKLGEEPLFDPEEGPNASIVISYDLDDKIDYIDKTIEGATWRKTFTWVGELLTEISEWVRQ